MKSLAVPFWHRLLRSSIAVSAVALLAAGSSSAFPLPGNCCSEQGSACTAPGQSLVATFESDSVACCDSLVCAENNCEIRDSVQQGVITVDTMHDPTPWSGTNISCALLAAGLSPCQIAPGNLTMSPTMPAPTAPSPATPNPTPNPTPKPTRQPWMPGGVFEAARVCFKNNGHKPTKLQVFVGRYEFARPSHDDPQDYFEDDTDLGNMEILKASIDNQTAALTRGACDCVELSEHAESPLRYAGMRYRGDVHPHSEDQQQSYDGGVRGFLKFAPGRNKTVYLASNGKWSYKNTHGCPAI